MSNFPLVAIPPKAGIGLKPQHYALLPGLMPDARHDIRAAQPPDCTPCMAPAWVEVHPQNYMGAGGAPHRWLEAIAQAYPISFHSTALSLGSASGCNAQQLAALADLVARYRPAYVSDHLSWSMLGETYFPDLLPLPMTHESLAHFAAQIGQVQDVLQCPIGIENPSRYVAFAGDDFAEPEFLQALCRTTGCWLLLDINNILVSAHNLGFDANAYLDQMDPAFVQEIHLAGHAIEQHESGPLLIDDHGSPISDATWALYQQWVMRAGPCPTLIEWDVNVPEYGVLIAEAEKANAILRAATATGHSRADMRHAA
jgi:uncharacterized protein